MTVPMAVADYRVGGGEESSGPRERAAGQGEEG